VQQLDLGEQPVERAGQAALPHRVARERVGEADDRLPLPLEPGLQQVEHEVGVVARGVRRRHEPRLDEVERRGAEQVGALGELRESAPSSPFPLRSSRPNARCSARRVTEVPRCAAAASSRWCPSSTTSRL
jgi:hypothetical protein